MRKNFKVIISLLLQLFCSLTSLGQSSEQNYVRSAVMIEPLTDPGYLTHDMSRITIDYYDGLGRPIQNIRVGASGSTFDLHSLTEYDQYGRAYRSWLPVEVNSENGVYVESETIKGIAQSYYADTHPFTETIAERTPELTDSELYGVGKSWRDAGKRTVVRSGINSGASTNAYCCPRFDVDTSGRLVMNGYYEEGTLRYEETIDEDSLIMLSFFDKEKRKILESKTNGDLYNDTYYVYNVIGQLIYVIPPKAAVELLLAEDGVCDMAIVRKQCYYYAYDEYNRMIEKRFPGAEPEYYVYDALDNVVLSQNGNLRSENKWRVLKLDNKYRKAVEGVATLTGETRASLQARWGNEIAIESVKPSYAYMDKLFYSDTCGIENFEPEVSYFYDTYDHWINLSGMNDVPVDEGYNSGLGSAIGLLTGKAVWDNTIGKQYVVSVITYDDRKRIITESEIDYDRMYNLTTHHKYNFAGDLIGKKSVLVNNDLGETTTSEYFYNYDYSGSLLEVQHRYNGGSWNTLYTCVYDEIKRLYSKTILPKNAPVKSQTLRYKYNIRGWITEISSLWFSQSFRYQDTAGGSVPRWGGSPSEMSFTSVNDLGMLDTCAVNYGYDWLDRLVSVTQTADLDGELTFSETFAYDENGNPEIITRGNVDNNPVQNISLSYNGNQILSLNESKPAEGLYPHIPSIAKGDYELGWAYDANGNRTAVPSRNITSITYNHYNQPVKISFADGSNIEHNYRSDGTNVGRIEREAVISTVNGGSGSAITYRGKEIHRIGDFELSSTTPKRVYIEGGYIDIDYYNKTYSYNYYIQDGQGSVRAVIDENGTLKQATDYSAYGVPSTRYTDLTVDNHLHLGLEWQSMKGLYGYYNNARFRDVLFAGAFYQHDQLAEKYYSFSLYHYSACNPLKFADVDGRKLFAVHGTRSTPETWSNRTQLNNFATKQFGDTDFDYNFKWSGGNYAKMRTQAAKELVSHITKKMEGIPNTEPITIVGHSHGGNVGIEAYNMMVKMPEFEDRQLNLVTINTPVRGDYQLSNEAQQRVNHINVYDSKDPVQVLGGNFINAPYLLTLLVGECGLAGRTFKNAQNISVDNPVGIDNFKEGKNEFGDIHNSHNRLEDWINKVK